MTTLVVPTLDEKPWPSLGGQVCDFIEDLLVFGPGDLRGEPAVVDDEKRALIYRAYEVFPKAHVSAGRRRFKRVTWMLRKGTAKTEVAAWLAAVELHPEGPVRCDGWDADGNPVGRPVRDPYIPMVAYTEEQSEDLAYGALYAILSESRIADDFDIGLERIMRLNGDGKAVALASAPDARDGARTTFQHFDETHRFVLPRLKEAHRTMLANIPKRKMSDAWSLETTTAYSPGEGSVAESTHDYARKVASGDVKDSRLFFFYRVASDKWDITEPDQLAKAIVEASGPAAEWSDLDSIAEQFREPDADRAFLERVWLNRLRRSADRAFDTEKWKELAVTHACVGELLITLGFDGSRNEDATALIATCVACGYQWPLGIWEHERRDGEWHVPVDEVELAVERAFAEYRVWRMNCDPWLWSSEIRGWAGKYGDKVVIEWWTNRHTAAARMVMAYASAIANGNLTHSGDPRLTAHVGNAHRRVLNVTDEDGKPMWVIQKERPDSPHKIDAAMAGALSWEARTLAISSGALKPVVTPRFISFDEE